MPGILPRETLLRLALLRQADGNPRPLQAVLGAFPGVAAAVIRQRFLDTHLRDCLAPLCVDDATLCRQYAADIAVLTGEGVSVVGIDDPAYSPLLAEINAPPPMLFCRGRAALLTRPQLAIVGSRNASPAGLATARAFAADLAATGFVITSGMALGIDAMAHEGAMAAGGSTIAVLGCGVDVVYPRRHAALASAIAKQGCLVTEYLPGTPPRPGQFPLRNRIISALSLGVLVVEAAPDSGSLITARFAAEQGREVFAIPGSIHSPLSRGCHQLIREGATLVETSAQIMESLTHFVLPGDRAAVPASVPVVRPALLAKLPPEERQVLEAIPPAGCVLDQIVLGSGMPVARVAGALAALEVHGLVHALAGGLWQPVS